MNNKAPNSPYPAPLPFLSILLALLFAPFTGIPTANAQEQPGSSDATSRAIERCIGQIETLLKQRRDIGPDLSCDIPVSLAEKDLDQMFKEAVRSAEMSDKWRGRAEKYTRRLAKTVTNFRAANCRLQIRASRDLILAGLQAGSRVDLILDDQPVTCDVTTDKHETRPLSFAFSPVFTIENGCVHKFKPKMGKIDAGCKLCYFDRLYLATKLISVWVNHVGQNARRGFNHMLGGSCRSL